MPLVFPLSTAEWMDILAVEDITFSAPPQVEMSQTAGGEVLRRRIGPSLWRGEVRMYNLRYGCGSGRQTLLSALAEPGASFFVYNPRRQFPQDDPDGSLIASSTPTLTAVASNGNVQLAGMPGNYQLRAGDLFSFTYGSNPVRLALHSVVQDRRANGSGAISGLIVHPPIRTGWTAGTAVRFIKPVCKAVITDLSDGVYGPVALSGPSFRWQQTLR